MGTHRTCCPVEAGPTCDTARRTRSGALPVPAAVPHAALHFACATCYRWCQETDVDNGGSGSGVAEGSRGDEDGCTGARELAQADERSFSFSLAVGDARGGFHVRG
jgi:hypothetical protein